MCGDYLKYNTTTFSHYRCIKRFDWLAESGNDCRFVGMFGKTILSDVDAINNLWGEHVGIEYSRTNGLRLNDALHNKTRQLARNLMDESEAFIF